MFSDLHHQPQQPVKLNIDNMRLGDIPRLIQVAALMEATLRDLVDAIDVGASRVELTPEVSRFAGGFVNELRDARTILGMDRGW